MESHEVLKTAFEKSSPKEVASELGVSLSLVYKWAQEQSDTGSGSRNPLDRVIELFKLTGDYRILEYICEHSDGYFVRNPVSHCEEGFQVLPATNEIVAQFAALLMRISLAAQDNSITNNEAEDIRHSWDKLKGYGEGFVRCCEEGDFESMEEDLEKTTVEVPTVRKTLY
ncbi:MAG: phage regulatory CII family protein [Akkermansiaceae bacterium]